MDVSGSETWSSTTWSCGSEEMRINDANQWACHEKTGLLADFPRCFGFLLGRWCTVVLDLYGVKRAEMLFAFSSRVIPIHSSAWLKRTKAHILAGLDCTCTMLIAWRWCRTSTKVSQMWHPSLQQSNGRSLIRDKQSSDKTDINTHRFPNDNIFL